MVDTSFKDEEIKIIDQLTNEKKEFDEQLAKERKYSTLKLNDDFLISIIHIKKELIGFFLFLISYLYYYLSLETCLKGEERCSLLYKWQLAKVYQEIISVFILAFILELIFYKFLSKLHLVHFFFVFLLFYIYSHGMVFEDHGFYNFIYFFIVTTLIMISIIPLNFLFCIIRKKKKIPFIYSLSLIIIIYFFYFFIYIKKLNCDDWGKGLNETFIMNNNSKYA